MKKSGNSYVHEGGKIFLWKRSQKIMIAGERIMGSFKKVGKNSKKEKFLIVSKELLPPTLTKRITCQIFLNG